MINVIILDDHQMFIDGILNSFTNDKTIKITGFANNGSSGISLIKALNPDIVILDIDFTKTHENGVDILKQIRKQNTDVKVLILTGYCDNSLIESIRNEGANGYLMKNIDMEQLRSTIISIFEGEIVFRFDSQYINKDKNTIPQISERATEIIKMLSQGFIIKEISNKLGIAETTVNDHLERTKRKLGAKNNVELVYLAGKNGLI